MSIEKLDKQSWHKYFDSISKSLTGKQAEIAVESLAIGSQLESEFAPLIGIVYDQKSELLEIMLEGWEHNISHVEEIWVDHDGISLKSVSVVDKDGVQQIIKLRDPLMLSDAHLMAGAGRPGPGAGAPR